MQNHLAYLRCVLCLSLLLAGIGAQPILADDEFAAWNPDSSISETTPAQHSGTLTCCPEDLFRKTGVLGLMTLFTLAGARVLHKPGMLKIRPLILLLSLSILGFVFGASPCLIKGTQSPFAVLGGAHALYWIPVGGLLGVLVLTVLFGPAFCGWACPMGALQEFLFLNKNAANSFARTGRLLLWIRRIAFLLLIIWLTSTGIVFWGKIDPFKAVFNLQVFNWTTGIPVAVLLLSSIYVFRPFCRTLCPIGLLNGLTAGLPFVPGPQVQPSCTRCMLCAKACSMGALNDPSHINMELCIGCGDCLNSCKRDSIRWGRKHSQGTPCED